MGVAFHWHDDLQKHITLGNIYRPPKYNNIDPVILTFINELSPIIAKLGKEQSETILVGNFNIDLLKVNERQTFADYLDLFYTNSLISMISLPTRFSSANCTLIDQVFCKMSNATSCSTARVIFSNISDHLPYYVTFDKLQQRQGNVKYVNFRVNN